MLLLDFKMPFFGDHDGPAVVQPLSDNKLKILGISGAAPGRSLKCAEPGRMKSRLRRVSAPQERAVTRSCVEGVRCETSGRRRQ